MDFGTLLQIALTAVIAAFTTLLVNAYQERERVSCFVDWTFNETMDGMEELPYLGVHNRSSQPIAVHSVRWVVNGFLMRRHEEGTALAYEDPFDLSFPYVVARGEIRSLVLDGGAARRLAGEVGRVRATLFRVIGKHRILIEVRTTAQTRLLVKAEGALPWRDRIPSARL